MAGIRARGEDIRRYILQNVEKNPAEISRLAADHFGITRQAVNKHLQRLTEEGVLEERGKTRARHYKIAAIPVWHRRYERVPGLEEDRVWTNDIKLQLGNLATNVLNIWHTGFTEMFNNAIEHSESTFIWVYIGKTAIDCQMMIYDDGIGIFDKIQRIFNLEDPRHAILELAKGKLTTDSSHHSGEGIFFTSRMFDSFDILSKCVAWAHEFGKEEEWIIERQNRADVPGTAVFLKLGNHTAKTAAAIYRDYAAGEEYGFKKTVVPVRLAQYGNDQLVSRSQAKRLLSRVDKFKLVLLDFENVSGIGQGFADEIFRVFKNSHPEIEIEPINASEEIRMMIAHAQSARADGQMELPLPSLSDRSSE
jgi:anti-sigma regulatory factor (Ser/Thr protein kinase)